MNIRQLETFIVLTEELNFRKAAERTNLTQPALSQQLRQIEQELQVALFSRTNRQVRLTKAGEIFLTRAAEIVKRMEETKNIVRQVEKGINGTITVGATTPAIYILLAEIVSSMKAKLPEIAVTIHNMDTQTQEEELRKNRIDIGVGHTPFEDKSLGVADIAKIPFDVVMAKQNHLATKKILCMKDLAEETFILFPRKMAPLQYDKIISLSLEEGFSPRGIMEASPAQAIIACVGCDLGIGFIASKQQQFKHPHVVYRTLSGPRPYFTLGVVYRRENRSPAIDAFIKTAQDVGRGVF